MQVIMVGELLLAMCLSGFLQGLKVFDSSVETITTGTWQALGTAWKSGSLFVQKYIPHFYIYFSFCCYNLANSAETC